MTKSIVNFITKIFTLIEIAIITIRTQINILLNPYLTNNLPYLSAHLALFIEVLFYSVLFLIPLFILKLHNPNNSYVSFFTYLLVATSLTMIILIFFGFFSLFFA